MLALPFFQWALPFAKEKPLEGIDPPASLPDFTTASWFNEEYQKSYSPLFEQNIGFHNSLVRLYNQLNYSVFGYASAGDVIVGKENCIFLKPYVNAYTGADFIGAKYIDIQTKKIHALQTILKEKNIDLFVVLAPGKGSFFSENIPSRYKKSINPDSTNYACYKKSFAKYNVNLLDLRSHFSSIKSSEKYPLYSTTGVHWTEYGCYVAGKEMVAYVEKMRKLNLPKIKLRSVEMLSLAGKYSNDYDAANLMNVFSTIPHPDYAIPKLEFVSDSTTTKPRFLCVADSYFAGIVNTDIPFNAFTNYHYWLYCDRIFPESYLNKKVVSSLDLKKEIDKQEVICLLATDASLGQFPFRFIDKAYEIYAKKDVNYYTLKNEEFRFSILKIFKNINENKQWKNMLIENAKSKGISETDEFILNALWLYEQENKLHYFIIKTLNSINKNNKWKSELIANAKRKGISEMDEFIENAVCLYEQEQLKIKNE